MQNHEDEAEESCGDCWNKVKENKPRNLILTYLNLARLFDELGQSKKAMDYFDLALG